VTDERLSPREQQLIEEIEKLRLRLEEPESTIDAIRQGAVDAFVVSGADGERIYTIHPADPPYRRIVEEMKEGAATLSTDGTILYANRRLGEMLKVDAGSLRSRSLRDFVARGHARTFDRLLVGSEGGRAEIAFRASDGAVFPASVAASAFRDEDVTAFSLVVTDLTEQKANAELAAAEAAWREADRRKDEFLATLGHELRTPLAAIGRASEVIEHLSPSEAKLLWACDVIRRQVRSMARMVEDLLDVSRIATGKMALRKETVDLTGLVSTIAASLGPLFEEKGRSLSVSIPEGPVLVEADPTRFAQVVSNLLQNALKFTRNGGHVWISLAEDAGSAILKVRDDGMGIPPELLDRVFDLFAQGERAAVRPESGLGIGLTLVRRLTELQGGTVGVASSGPDTGAEFTVTLPSSRAARLSKPPGAPAPAAPAVSRRVLIVEDDADLMQGLALLLQIHGHDVATAVDGPSALALCAEFRPEAVLLDLGLPGMDGFEAVRRLRSELGPETLIVALTGYNLDEDRIRTAEAGFDHHLVKPVELDEIHRLLATLDE
jgi:PAS domain S-box-containing protein